MVTTLWCLGLIAVQAAPFARPGEPVAASHRGYDDGARLVWRSRVVEESNDRPTIAHRLDLAYPLPADSVDAAALGDQILLERGPGGEILALVVQPEAWRLYSGRGRRPHRWSLELTSIQPHDEDGGLLLLRPPLLRGKLVQELTLEGVGDPRFEPGPQAQLTRYISYLAGDGIDDADIRHCRRNLDSWHLGMEPSAIYLRAGDQLAAAGGIPGRLVSQAAHRRVAMAVVAAGSVLLLGGLVALFGVLTRVTTTARRRQALESELRRLDHTIDALEEVGLETTPRAP